MYASILDLIKLERIELSDSLGQTRADKNWEYDMQGCPQDVLQCLLFCSRVEGYICSVSTCGAPTPAALFHSVEKWLLQALWLKRGIEQLFILNIELEAMASAATCLLASLEIGLGWDRLYWSGNELSCIGSEQTKPGFLRWDQMELDWVNGAVSVACDAIPDGNADANQSYFVHLHIICI